MDATIDIIKDRMLKSNSFAHAHAIASERLGKWHYALGIPVVILTTIVGTAAFASLADLSKVNVTIAVLTGVFSATAATLAALQTFFSFGERSRNHAQASDKFFALWRRMQRTLLLDAGGPELKQKIIEFDDEIAKIVQEAPYLPHHYVSDGLRRIGMWDAIRNTAGSANH
jgi:hypothetical protein